MIADHIIVVDCTLREGNQSPGTAFDPVNSVVVAAALHAANVQHVEIGHPSASANERARTEAVVRTGLFTSVMGHSRAHASDIRAVADTGASWVGIFLGVNEYSQRFRLRRDAAEIISTIGPSVALARSLGLRVRYTVEDASRTPYPDMLKAYLVAIDAGAERVCFADSVGICDPAEVRSVISALRRDLPPVDLEVHFHDDRGLALANTLEAIGSGATHVSSSVNGLGERCGIVDTCMLVANLHHLGVPCGVDPATLYDLSQTVAEAAGDDPGLRRPVVGRHSFTHTARLHQVAVRREPACYNWRPPAEFGRSATIQS
ncbi:LeuA family protein [Symbioplanes lichenis]|uniref:LeuA family protein n=1 Tax=Symbioplanes lichenis TaxID=1629072 RepID=UPI002738ECDF|nr:LeuA family protein [Actinoplanes lichenis]